MTASADPRRSTGPSAADLLLAVDAGGTKTAAWLVDLNRVVEQRILGRGRASAGNPLSAGFDQATRAITEAVRESRQQAGHGTGRVPRAILSIAGAANPEVANRFLEWLRPLDLAERVAIVSDVLPVLAAGTPQCTGVALVAGTGSVAFGRDTSGTTALCGGWGYLLGDEGSAYDIGRAALRHTLRQLEAGRPLDPLAAVVVKSLGAISVLDVTRAVYAAADARTAIASLAPLVLESSNEAADSIVEAAAYELASLVARVTKLITLNDATMPLAVSGGLLAGSNRLQERLMAQTRRLNLECTIEVVDEPLTGCVRLATPEFASTIVKWSEI